MVTKIISGKSIRGMLHYNENKVTANEAHLMMASGFAADITSMNLEQKLQRFEHLTMLNGKVKTNALHITLNFDNQDKLSNEQLQQITASYMEKIGFGDQPYLVYKHADAAHPHLHIATTNMKADGKRIDIHGIGRTLSETARKELEKEFKLVKAEGRQFSNVLGIKPADIEKAIYGKTPTKRTITNIVNAVIRTYKFTSLAEMNAVLKQFNVMANRGKEDTQMYKHKGLLYSIINEKSEQIGVPIKASAIYDKPTLPNLEKEFEKNFDKRKAFKEPLKETIEKVFVPYVTISKNTFVAKLQEQNINAVFRINEQGFTYGITYIDNKNKAIFNGSDLGKAYSAKAIMDRLSTKDKERKPVQQVKLNPTLKTPQYTVAQQPKTYLKPPEQTNYLALALAKYQPEAAPSAPRKKKRKKGKEQDQGLAL
jgi:hypothetical protein